MPPAVQIVSGDLLDQDVDVIVNAWNRNIIPWWLLIPQGVSRAIKKRGGYEPFREVARHGPIPLGGAVLTRAGRLPFKGIIHVAGISMLWRSSERSIRASVSSALLVAKSHGFGSVAMPLIGAGTGGGDEDTVQAIIESQLGTSDYPGRVVVVRYAPALSKARH
jgi:O-acetyl-ADP-ribose deacetylase